LTDGTQNNIDATLPKANELLLLKRISEGDWGAYADLFNHYLPKLSQYIFPFAGGSRAKGPDTMETTAMRSRSFLTCS